MEKKTASMKGKQRAGNIVTYIVLILISMVLTYIAGLIPARLAAKKDPVVALRSE